MRADTTEAMHLRKFSFASGQMLDLQLLGTRSVIVGNRFTRCVVE